MDLLKGYLKLKTSTLELNIQMLSQKRKSKLKNSLKTLVIKKNFKYILIFELNYQLQVQMLNFVVNLQKNSALKYEKVLHPWAKASKSKTL